MIKQRNLIEFKRILKDYLLREYIPTNYTDIFQFQNCEWFELYYESKYVIKINKKHFWKFYKKYERSRIVNLFEAIVSNPNF